MNKFFVVFFSLFLLSTCAFSQDTIEDTKQKAYALYNTGNYKEARTLFERLPQNEKDAEIFLLLSNIALEENRENTAIQNLNKAIDKDYTYYKAYYNLGLIFASKKSYILAKENFKLALKYNKNSLPIYYNLAVCEIAQGNYQSAKKYLIKAQEINPKDKDTLYNLALCYKNLGQNNQAKKILEIYNKLEQS